MAKGATRRGAVLIAGPTASGKSALAMETARRIGGAVVNADSMQVYRELRILTARPSPADEEVVPHRLYGYRGADEACTVAAWLADVSVVLGDLAREGRPAVVVGGTGLYFTALTGGLSAIPAIPEPIRERLRAAARERTAADLHADLARLDPITAARLRPTDTQRIVRALEVLEATGRSITAFHGARTPPVLPADAVAAAMVLAPAREDLHRRIAARFEAMAAAGGLDEARQLAEMGLDPSLPAMKAIGVPEMIAAATGERPLEEAVASAITATRRYARRQETWFRNQMPGWTRIDPGNFVAAAELVAQQMKNGG
jgi:tRNA dimethylallyltransferase